MRLSKEDEFIRDESNSISSQRELLRKYVKNHSDLRKMQVIEIKDDGYSGKNLERPGMQELLELVKQQKVGCIIVKDISRFSRDHLETGKYLEQIFPFMQVRFIAVNDNYDSNDYAGGIGEIDVAFKEILYDFYSEDLSEKIKSSFKVRKAKGKFMASFAPYGYRKHPEDKNRLIVDDKVAPVVKRIYAEYLGGKSMYKIAQDLNREQVMSPCDYIEQENANIHFANTESIRLWTGVTIGRILGNEVYTGSVINCKSSSLEVAAKHSVMLPKSEWNKVEGMHEAIVSKEDYDAVQDKRRSNKKRVQRHESHCLATKMVCGNCGHRMAHSHQGRPKYECRQHFQDPKLVGCVKSVLDSELEPLVLRLIQEQVDMFADATELMEMEKKKHQDMADAARNRLHEMQNSLEKLEGDRMEAYESFRTGLTEKETYLEQKQVYDQMEQKLQENIQKQMQAVGEIENEESTVPGINLDQDSVQVTELTKEIVDQFIEKITVYDGGRMDVVWKFEK
jgi:DNA invertase Pin-like site-specific DNA recombinase